MCTLEEYQKKGLFDLFISNQEHLINLSNSLVKNNMDIISPEDALNVLFLHGGGINSILNKKLITKEILFKYLHNSNISIGKSNTKIILIEKVLEYWKTKFRGSYEQEMVMQDIECGYNETSQVNSMQQTQPLFIQNNFYLMTNNETINNDAEKFPVNKLAIQFSEWFYVRFNRNELKIEDFWADVKLNFRILNVQTHSIENIQNSTNIEVLQALLKIKEIYDFTFNPNISHKGCQGRIDKHGLVLILSCGTIQKSNNCIGIFESTFGLARDLNAENNWKVTELKLFLKNVNITSVPALETCETLNDIFCLPQTNYNLN